MQEITNYFYKFVNQNRSLFPMILAFLFGLLFVLRKNREQDEIVSNLQVTLKDGFLEPTTLHPEINTKLCFGCGSCVEVCPENYVLGVVDGKSILANPTQCVGHGMCEEACPTKAISLVFGTKNKGMKVPDLNSMFESRQEGLYIAGELGGIGLISNAIKQGKIAAIDAINKINNNNLKSSFDYDVLIVGAGPSGFSAALTCHELDVRYLCIEQNVFGGTIYHYPRQKLVMSNSIELSMVGELRFKNNLVNKEELLEQFIRVRNEIKPNIRENSVFENLRPYKNGYKLVTSNGTFSSEKIILCTGVGGTPMKLNIPGEEKSKVTYRLKDAAQFTKQKIMIVGAGNAAVEAAIDLTDKELHNKVTIIVRGAGFPKCNFRNRQAIERLIIEKNVEVHFESRVKEIFDKQIDFFIKDKLETIQNDIIFIIAGSKDPYNLIQKIGVTVSEKFGEPLHG